jgi:uncharacterized protein (TIGR02231 family)
MKVFISILSGHIEAFQKEKMLLDASQNLNGKDIGVSAAELKRIAYFYRSRITGINTEIVKLQRKQEKLSAIINRLGAQVRAEDNNPNPPMDEITILANVIADIKIASSIEIRYVVSNAGWAPAYDLIAEDIGKPIELKYRAKVFNNTSVDWKNVKIRLSTGDPMRSAAAPQPERWALNFQSDNFLQAQNRQLQPAVGGVVNITDPASLESLNLGNNNQSVAADYDMKGRSVGAKSDVVVQYDEIQISELSAKFEIKTSYDIPADGQPYIVDVTAHNLNATYQYRKIPRLEREAFLMTRITGWEELDLVEGPANVYFGGTYVGQSYIYTRSTNDTLDLSLGRDKKLIVPRTKVKELNSAKASGTTKKERSAFENVVKRTRKSPINVELINQIPVSQNTGIVLETQQLSNGELDRATGFITWKLNIPPGESEKVSLSYSVKWSKNKAINTQSYKKAKRAQF